MGQETLMRAHTQEDCVLYCDHMIVMIWEDVLLSQDEGCFVPLIRAS